MNAARRSIAVRLTLATGAVSLTVLTLCGLLLDQVLTRELRRADQEALASKIKIVKHFIGESRDGDLPSLKHHLDDALIGHTDLRVWLMDQDDRPVYGAGQPPHWASDTEGKIVQRELDDGMPLEGLRYAIVDSGALGIRSAIVAVDVRPRLRLMKRYREALLLVGALGVAAALGFGALVARRGMRPVRRLSDEAEQISPDAMSARLSADNVDNELVGLARSFNGVLDRMELAYRRMEAFDADVAHELRTPLATLISGIHVMLSSDRSAAELREVLTSNLEELEYLNLLVNDMLFMARADHGDKAQRLQPSDLAAEATKTVEYFDALLDEAGIQVVVRGKAKAPCDPALIRRAISNLLSNAIKHTARGQTISINIEPDPRSIRVSVFNPGAALPEEVLKRMFDRFFRVGASANGPYQGNGLGLSIVKAIARMHGGDVFARTENAGNTIGFFIRP